jgi:hypothetical protein
MPSMPILNFQPDVTYTVTGATPTPTLQALKASGQFRSVRIYSPNTNGLVYLAFGASTVVATTSSTPFPGGNTEVWDLPELVTSVSVLAASGSPVVYFTMGLGS